MGAYVEARAVKESLIRLIDERISQHPSVREAIKAKKAVVTTPPSSATENKVGVRFPQDQTEIFLPFNSKFLSSELTVGKVVSVWYYQSIINAIVMEDGAWLK